MQFEGIILKGIGGFYYVETSEGVFECKAKGKFRKELITPLSGDRVVITVNDINGNSIDEILPRKNSLKRPPVANLDKLFIVISVVKPIPNTLVIDKMTVLAEKNGIEPILIITKTDLEDASGIVDIYSRTGYKLYTYSDVDKQGVDAILNEIDGNVCAFTGNSGVGKSTLINALHGNLQLETAQISDKLGRGRHTTRQAEIFHIGGGLVVDTAGFSNIDFEDVNLVFSDELELYFREFSDYLGECRFTGCSHTGEKGCKICELVSTGEISKSRHESYAAIFNEVKKYKPWNV